MLGMDQPRAQLLPPGCDVPPVVPPWARTCPCTNFENKVRTNQTENPQKNPKPTTPEKAKQTTPTQTKMTHKKPIKPPSPTNKQNNTQPPPSKTTSVLGGSAQGTTQEGRD